MAIVNRDLDASEQRKDIYVTSPAIATGVTQDLVVLAYPCTIQTVEYSALGVSNAMQVAFNLKRFISGSGATAIAIGISNCVLQNFGTSGAIAFSGLAAVGSTLLNFQSGDVLQIVTSVANGNATSLAMNLVLKKTQDVVTMNGASS